MRSRRLTPRCVPSASASDHISANRPPRTVAAVVLAATALVVVSASLSGAPASATPAWSTVKSPNGAGPISRLNAVSCPTASFCAAVGYYHTPLPALVRRTFAERWNGTAWTVVAIPSPSAATAELRGVSCTSNSFCVAVGSSTNHHVDSPAVERWDGTRWSIVAGVNNSSGNSLSAVSCTSVTSCWAVGTLIQRWDDKLWITVASVANGSLRGVSCSKPSLCFAVGSANRPARLGGAPATLTERWNGKTWTVVPSPNGPHSDHSYLNGVSCASASFCFAVGQSDFATDHEGVPGSVQWLFERWDGKAWSVVAAPKPKNVTVLTLMNGVSCPSVGTCFGAGYYYREGGIPTVLERWNGVNWSIAYDPSANGSLFGVSCASTTFCFAVGQSGLNQTLVQRYA